jgi:thiol:disulfide interchange protein DsbG
MKRVLLAAMLSLPLTAIAATASAPVTATPSASTADPAASQLVQKITQGQVKITQTFNAVDNLQGFVIQPNNGSDNRSMIVYTDKSGQYMFIGTIIDSNGQNLTDKYTQQYINSGVAQTAYQQLPSTSWFVEGSDKAPHKAYVIIDPNCIYCHLLYQEVEPMIKSGQLQVRWIPVGFLHASSAGKAASLLNAGNNKAQIAALNLNESQFNTQAEEGGITALENSSDPQVSAAFSKVQANTSFFSQMGFGGTPTILYKDAAGNPNFYPGFAKGDQLQKLIDSMGNNW